MFSKRCPMSHPALKVAFSLALLSLATAASAPPAAGSEAKGDAAPTDPPPARDAPRTAPAPTAGTDKPGTPPAQAQTGEQLTADEAKVVELMTEFFRDKDKDKDQAAGQDTAMEDPNLLLRRYSETDRRARLNAFANAFYRVLPQRNLELLKMLCDHPFHFEGRRVESEQAFEAEWARIFANLRLGAVPMKRMQIFSAEEMVRHFGERPSKLAGWPVDEASYFSVAEFGAQVVIVLWRQSGDLFVAEAIHG